MTTSVAPEKNLHSSGRLCEILQASPGQIEKAATAANIEPSLKLNGVPYFSDADVNVIREHLPKRK